MSNWPELDPKRDHPTFTLLHLAAQMLGKVRVRHAPWSNHGWHSALQPTPTGMQTLPTGSGDGRTFVLALDLCRHVIALRVSDSVSDEVPLDSGSVAALHSGLAAMLERHRLPVAFHGVPNEIDGAVPFASDSAERLYQPDSAERFRDAMARILPVFERFRAGFLGKASPVHFWWGAFDLAVTRFSGRPAPTHPGGLPGLPDPITREAYSHEVSSAGFWAGGAVAADPFFYSYAYPEPPGFRDAAVAAGSWNADFQEFTLAYSEVQQAADPEVMLSNFLQSTYLAAADLARWDREALEREATAPR